MKSLRLFILWTLISIHFFSYSQESFVCKKFKSGETTTLTIGSNVYYFDAVMAQHLADYYNGLRYEYKEENGVKVLKRNKAHYPKTGSKNGNPRRPYATPALIRKHFPESYLQSLKKCAKTSRDAYARKNQPPAIMKDALQKWIDSNNRRFQSISKGCAEAASALRQLESKVSALSNDMRAYCDNETKEIEKEKNFSKEGNKSKKGSTDDNKKDASDSKENKESKKKSSYSKAKSSVKKSEISKKIDGAALLRAKQFEEYQRRMRMMTIEGQWESLNAMDRKLANFLQNTFWKNMEERQRKEQSQYNRALSRESSIFGRNMRNHIEHWQTYQMKVTNWLLEYSSYTTPKILERLQKDIKTSQEAISKAYKHHNMIKRGYERRRENGPNGISAKGLGKIQWDSFRYSSDYEDIQGAPFSAFYTLRGLVETNSTNQNRSMLGDYAKMAYDHIKRYSPRNKRKQVQYARVIVDNFSEFPGLSTLQYEVETYDKEQREANRLEDIRKAFNEVFTLSYQGKGEELDARLEMLTEVPATPEIKEAFFGPKGNHTQLNKLYENGHTEAMLKLYDWLGGKYLSYSRKRNNWLFIPNLINAFLISDQKSDYQLNKEINLLINNHITKTYGRDRTASYSGLNREFYRTALQALAGTTTMEAAKNMAKSLRKASKKSNYVYETWYAKAVLFRNDQVDYLIPKNSKRSYRNYLGIWTRATDNWKYEEVTYVATNSPADLNGIQKGDRIILNKKPRFFKPFKTYSDNISSVTFSILKQDGKIYRTNIPIRITKQNIKNKFKGTSELIGTR